MDSSWVALALGILGGGGISGLGGYLLAGRNERKRDDRADTRSRADLQEQQAAEGRTFQRDTLLELHDLLYKINRVSGRTTHLDEMHYRKTGKYGREPIPEELSVEFSELIGGIHRLRVRIFDSDLREMVGRYAGTLVRVGTPSGLPRRDGDDSQRRARGEEFSMDALAQWPLLEEKLGAAIRLQFPGSDLTPFAG